VNRGLLIVIEGGDACGKQTQSNALRQRLDDLNVSVPAKLFSFPRYNTPLGQAIIRHLKRKTALMESSFVPAGALNNEEWKVAPEDALVFQCMMVADKYHAAAEIEEHLAKGGHVVCDRWWQSAYVYGQSDDLNAKWLQEVHERMPKVDVNILIDVPAHSAVNRRPVARDRYEESIGTRERVRRLYLETWEARRLDDDWVIIDGLGTIDVVHEAIWKVVWPYVEEYKIS
jgi:thymidylate kinase